MTQHLTQTPSKEQTMAAERPAHCFFGLNCPNTYRKSK